jgi:porphobilinogen synthase
VFPAQRPRRLRRTPAIRRLVAETALTPSDFVAPLFVAEGLSEPRPILSLPGQFQHTVVLTARRGRRRLVGVGVTSVILFGVPALKDELGSAAWDRDGVSRRWPFAHCATPSATTRPDGGPLSR